MKSQTTAYVWYVKRVKPLPGNKLKHVLHEHLNKQTAVTTTTIETAFGTYTPEIKQYILDIYA